MSTRILWTTALAALVAVAGCGKARHVLAPDQDAAVAARATAGLPADGAESRHEEGEGRDDARHAQPITGPAVITSPGTYRLTDDFTVTQGDGIVIRASHVRLWLGDHRLSGPGHKIGRAIVIEGAENVQVVGGRIESFGIGAALLDASRCRVASLDIRGGDETANPAAGNPPQIGIMLVNSAMNEISGNEMSGINLGIFVRGGGSYRNRIVGNEARGGQHGLLGICYNPAPGGDPAGPHDDRVTRNLLARFGTGIVTSPGSAESVFRRNTIRYFTSAYVDENGTNVFAHNRTTRITP